ncbi:CMGC protein kinase [Aspergillus nomiae NRRL 13137]|uniref:non-specific serine/threonine protein kinase n=1 Tax=Aspergillus nomiae NRRL (strain ATCC 15546 / NRRL 13137 / CBS 260.88 / M93) TaxID=1509407 RepID=A0A0L1IXR0_ASPN3|nr:CMGC protein kinase [Aspergillus nomiae NRRL 13137]KNG83928.1 CMGC protein kinase [Aspergillus nomiae NRRL 13137]
MPPLPRRSPLKSQLPTLAFTTNPARYKSSYKMPQDAKTDIEEGTRAYRPGRFHPVYIGDVFKDRYKVLNKIGYGVYSTVWLVRDLVPAQSGPENEFRALKVLSAECYDGMEAPIFEREILTHLRRGDRHQLGYNHVCHILDDFEHRGPNGTHVCLVFELMGETLRSFGAWFAESRLPNSVMRRFTIQLLLVLDFFHEHNVIHTVQGLFLDRIRLPDRCCDSLQDRSEEQYSVVPSTPLRRYYFNEADSRRAAEFDIALGDWGVSSWTDRHLCDLIQPVALRSPEVLIQAPWDASTDFWNLGAVVLEVFQAVRMFSGSVPPDGHYELKEHLAEIVDLFGPFPNELLERGNESLVQNLFDGDGRIKDAPPMDRSGLASEAFMPGLDQELRDEFASFLQAMMKINPADRVSAEDLLRHPWLDAL